MKKLFYSFLSLTIAALSLTSCEDVPAPYEYPEDNNVARLSPQPTPREQEHWKTHTT